MKTKGAIDIINNSRMTEREIVIEELWLKYFNRYAYENDAITEAEYRKLESRILYRSAEKRRKYHLISGGSSV